jgi:hypothetical protein
MFIVDEFHFALSVSQRTSIILDVSKLAYGTLGLSGTIIKGAIQTNITGLVQWLEQIVEFEVTPANYYVAVGS